MNRHWLLTLPAMGLAAIGWFSAFGTGREAHSNDQSIVPAASGDLLKAVEASRDDFRPITEADILAVRQRTNASLAELQRQLEAGSAPHAEGWKAYLLWDELTEQLTQERPDPRVLRAVHERLRRNNKGLELEVFVRLREDLFEYANLLSFTGLPDLSNYYDTLLTELAKAWTAYQTAPSYETSHDLGRILGLLETSRQAPTLVARVREHFGQANVVAWVSADLTMRWAAW